MKAEFDAAKAKSLIGKTVVVGFTYIDENDKLIDQDQFHGSIKVAVMGCVVNGPGEAREADVGIACGKGEGLIFKKGLVVRKVPEAKLVDELMREIENL
jgi:(E)-4-hydroxy-3-methylbut-2-enyl-diphosphate synthase